MTTAGAAGAGRGVGKNPCVQPTSPSLLAGVPIGGRTTDGGSTRTGIRLRTRPPDLVPDTPTRTGHTDTGHLCNWDHASMDCTIEEAKFSVRAIAVVVVSLSLMLIGLYEAFAAALDGFPWFSLAPLALALLVGSVTLSPLVMMGRQGRFRFDDDGVRIDFPALLRTAWVIPASAITHVRRTPPAGGYASLGFASSQDTVAIKFAAPHPRMPIRSVHVLFSWLASARNGGLPWFALEPVEGVSLRVRLTETDRSYLDRHGSLSAAITTADDNTV